MRLWPALGYDLPRFHGPDWTIILLICTTLMADKEIIGIGEFRQRATEIIREVEETARSVIVARRGRPAVEIRPVRNSAESLIGSVTVMPGIDLTEPVIEASEWESTG